MSDQTWPSPDQPFLEIHDFKILGGKQLVEGKTYYPNLLRLHVSKQQAWEIAWKLFNELRQGGEEWTPDIEVVIPLSGNMREVKE